MFESIVLTEQYSQTKSNLLDIGSLVEKMFLYGKVIVISNYQILNKIYRFFGGDNLYWLLKEGYLNIIYQEHLRGIHTENEIHNIVDFFSPQHLFQDELRKICITNEGKVGKGRRMAQKLEKYISVSRDSPKILKGTKESILNSRYISSSAQIIINELVPNFKLNEKFSFNPIETDKGITIETTLNFSLIKENHNSTITPAYILSRILRLEEELFFAASFSSELSCSNLSTQLGVNKVDYIIENSIEKSNKLDNFKETVFNDVTAIKEAVNSGRVDLDDILHVLKKSRQYKEWILSKPPNANLLSEYLKKISENSFLEKLPGKLIRYSVFGGLGFITKNIEITACLGIFDTLFLDKLTAGWKPSHYIDDQINKLINK